MSCRSSRPVVRPCSIAAAALSSEAADATSQWRFVVTNRAKATAWISGWQDLDQPRRELLGGADAWALPAVELRLWDRDDGFLKAAAF